MLRSVGSVRCSGEMFPPVGSGGHGVEQGSPERSSGHRDGPFQRELKTGRGLESSGPKGQDPVKWFLAQSVRGDG